MDSIVRIKNLMQHNTCMPPSQMGQNGEKHGLVLSGQLYDTSDYGKC